MNTSVLVLSCLAGACGAASAQPYEVTVAAIGAGGATEIAGGSYSIGCTIGQAAAGASAGGAYQIGPGFWPAAAGSGCYADCNADGVLTVADFGCFQTRFVSGHSYADCNQSGTLTVADFGCFQTRFVAGCP